MSTPVVETIATVLKARLERITTGNGFNYTVPEVLRPLRLGKIRSRDFQIVLVQDNPVLNAEASVESGSGRLLAFDVIFAIMGYLRPSDTSTTPIETFINTFAADIQKAVTNPSDSSLWWEFKSGGSAKAMNAAFDAPQYFGDSDGSVDGVVVPLSVTYRTPENDPYTVG